MVEVLTIGPVFLNSLMIWIDRDLKLHALLALVDHKSVPTQRFSIRAVEMWQLDKFPTKGSDNSGCVDVGTGDRARYFFENTSGAPPSW